MPRSYPPELRRKVLDLLAAGRSLTEVADDLGISGACVFNWRKQDWIDRGETAGLFYLRTHGARSCPTPDQRSKAELAAAKRAQEQLKEAVPPRRPLRHHQGAG